MGILSNKPRSTAAILSSFSSMVEELNARSAASIADAEREEAAIVEAQQRAIDARLEAQRADAAANKIGELIN